MNKENINSCSLKPAEQKICIGSNVVVGFSFFYFTLLFFFFNKTKQITKQKTKRKKKETNQQSKDIVNWVGDGISKYDPIKTVC